MNGIKAPKKYTPTCIGNVRHNQAQLKSEVWALWHQVAEIKTKKVKWFALKSRLTDKKNISTGE